MSINLESNILSWTKRLRSDKYRLASFVAAFVKTFFSYNYPHYYRSASLAAAFVFSCCLSSALLPLCTNRGRFIASLVKTWMLMFDVYAWLSVKSSFEGLCLLFTTLSGRFPTKTNLRSSVSKTSHHSEQNLDSLRSVEKRAPYMCFSISDTL